MEMIRSKRELANAIYDNKKIEICNISKKLHRTIEMWARYGDIIIEESCVVKAH